MRCVREERAEWFADAAEFTPLVAVETECGTYLVRTSDKRLGASLFTGLARGEFAVVRRTIEVLGREAVADRVFVDVGANIGTSTIPALLDGFARAVAVEPEPENLTTLRLNLTLNCMSDRVTVVEAAATDHVGTIDLVVRPGTSGTHHVGHAKSPDARLVPVPAVMIDDLVEPDEVGLLWLDVQGHEPAALRGGKRLLEARCPIVFEVHRSLRKSSAMSELEAAIAGYSRFLDFRSDDGLRPMSEFHAFTEEFGRERRMTDVLILA